MIQSHWQCVINIKRNRFQTYKFKNFASELAQIDFFEVDVLLLAYAVVTPLRKAASYEQRKTNLGNQNFRRRIIMYSATYYGSTNEGILVIAT